MNSEKLGLYKGWKTAVLALMLCALCVPAFAQDAEDENGSGMTIVQLHPEQTQETAMETKTVLSGEKKGGRPAQTEEKTAEQQADDTAAAPQALPDGVLRLYEDEALSVRVEKHLVGVTNCYVAYVKVADPSQLRVAAAYSFERNQTAKPSAIAQRVGAKLAINGDYYSFYGRGFMVREGMVYGEKPSPGRDVLMIDERGDFYIEKAATQESMTKHSHRKIVNAFNFGPGLVVDGQALDGYFAKFNASDKPRQRSCIGQMERGSLEYVLVSCEGPIESEGGGLTLKQFADFVAGFKNAYNLDGGDSTALIFDGEKLNAVDNKKHRAITDIIYFVGAQEE